MTILSCSAGEEGKNEDMPGDLPSYLKPAGSPLYYDEEEMDLSYDLDQELMLFEEEQVSKLYPDLNSSLLLSDKLSLSLNQGDDEEVGECEADSSEEELDNYEESDNIGFKSLRKLDRDFHTSPRMLVRGVYRGDVLELIVRRKTEGNLVSWTLREMVNKKYVLNIKAKMLYSYDIGGGHKYGHRLRGGRGWEGFGYGFINLYEGSDTSIKHVDVHEKVFFEDSLYYHYSGENCCRTSDGILCKEPECGTRIWSVEFKAFSTVAVERGLYDISCNLRKEKLTERASLSMVAFFNGNYEIVLHRDGTTKSYIEVAWLKKDTTAPFDDRPDVDQAIIDNRSYFVWQTKVSKKTEELEDLYGEGGREAGGSSPHLSRAASACEFAPEVSSTPVKAGRSNQPTSCTTEKDMNDCDKEDLTINTEEFVEDYLNGGNEDNYAQQGNDKDRQWQNKLTECDACHFKGRIANHLRNSAACLKELRSRPALRMKGSDNLFIVKTTIIVGECPNYHCQSGCHEAIPEECVAWWKSEGWDILGWRGDKADADASIILQKIQKMLENRRQRRLEEENGNEGKQNVTEDDRRLSGCRSCGFEGNLMEHLKESQECFEAHVKHYISTEQPDDSSENYLRKKLMFELSAVLNTCARVECSSRKDVAYLATHLVANSQCLQYYQNEGISLGLLHWQPEDSARIIGRRISQLKRRINECKRKEDSRGCSSFKKEISALLSHVCFQCGTMGPVSGEELFQMTCVAVNADNTKQWRCARCTTQSPLFDVVSQQMKEEGQRLRSGEILQERALKAVILPGSNIIIFAPSILAEGYADGVYNGPSFSSAVLLPSQPPALEMLKILCDQAHQQKIHLDNYLEELLRRPIITDFQDFLSCLYRSMMANVKSVMDRIFKAISNVAKGEVLSWNPNTTNANKRTANLGMTLRGALQQVVLSSIIHVFIDLLYRCANGLTYINLEDQAKVQPGAVSMAK